MKSSTVTPGIFLRKHCFFKQKTAYEFPKRDWSSDVCSSDLLRLAPECGEHRAGLRARRAHVQRHQDRKSVVEGKRVELGGRRILKKKKTKTAVRIAILHIGDAGSSRPKRARREG